MDKNEKENLKDELFELLKKYKYFYKYSKKWWEEWSNEFINTLNTYEAFPKKHFEIPSPSRIKNRLDSLANKLNKEKEFYQAISQPDIFEDESNPKFEEFRKSLINLAEDLGFFEDHVIAYSQECPEGTFKKKKHSKLQSLIFDLLYLSRKIDSNVSEPTYHKGEAKGLLLDLTILSIRHIKLDIILSNNNLAKAIKKTIRLDEYYKSEDKVHVTVNKPPILNKSPKEQLHEQVVQYVSEGLDYRSIAEQLGIKKAKVQRIIDEEKINIQKLRIVDGYELNEIAAKRGFTLEAVKKLNSM